MKEWQSQAQVNWDCKVSRRHPPEVPSQGVVREDAAGDRPDPAGPVPAEGYRSGGGKALQRDQGQGGLNFD
jgi:hypothetical protein